MPDVENLLVRQRILFYFILNFVSFFRKIFQRESECVCWFPIRCEMKYNILAEAHFFKPREGIGWNASETQRWKTTRRLAKWENVGWREMFARIKYETRNQITSSEK